MNERILKSYALQVYGKNELNRVSKIILTDVIPQLQQYLNKRIDTLSGRSKKFVINMPEVKPIPMSGGFASLHGCNIRIEYNTVKIFVSICLNGGKYEDKTYYCQYFDRIYWIGETDNQGNLTKVNSLDEIVKGSNLDNVINLDDEVQKIEKLKQLEDEVSKLKYSIELDV